MTHSRRPLLAYTIPIFDNPDGPRYCVYCDAYGLEMNIDDEWPIDTVLMSPPDLVDAITEETDVTSMGTVFAGTSTAPVNGDFGSLVDAQASFVLLDAIDNLAAAFDAGLRVILKITPETDVGPILSNTRATSDNLVVAVQPDAATTPPDAQSVVAAIRQALTTVNCAEARIIVAAQIDENSILKYLQEDDIDGVLLFDTSFDSVMEILRVIAES
jgi:hypothetical protein